MAARWPARVGLALLFPVPACALVLGVNDTPTDVVTALCGCPDVSSIPMGGSCEDVLGARLGDATPDARANWLQHYADANCSLCNDAKTCFYTPPTCVPNKGTCSDAKECCSYPLAVCNNGVCL